MSADPIPCTVRSATSGECGAPSVRTFVVRGRTFGECAEHEIVPSTDSGSKIEVGAFVDVAHVGIVKTGTVVEVKGKYALVRVPVGRGASASTKIISRTFDAILAVR